MKKHLLVGAITGALLSSPLVQAAELDTLDQKISYIMGLDVATRMDGIGFNLDIDAFKQGLKELDGDRSLSDDIIQQAMQAAQERYQERQQAMVLERAEANQKLGAEFLASNASKEGVVTTDSGLQYKVISEGSGPMPAATDTVRVHYRGTLVDGTEFDSSYKHGGPATFPLNGVIPGWTEGLQLIKQGSKAEFYIPAELAYGNHGMGQLIGPNATLIFEVELLEINPAQ
ncbi:FKBP-type peptidyl-prolyl cis-trans isomerase [Motiliproteus sediminis]|uniref:FKBP-type peptidyl-prolyl cis-trans isomerase n=1 Tax=Motiliproteus sediminis TaxID=1468178 RepID=UPI001AEFBCD8|nr:FKBP-type peptidyl-prolyl cis-trans isomerase [Motiliproteus sediminis]